MAAEHIRARIRAAGAGPVRVISLTLDVAGFDFEAGQYLNVVHPGGHRIPFSIATPPQRLPELELHFQPTAGHPQSRLMEEALRARFLDLEGPFGDTTLDKAQCRKTLFICAGSGFGQAAAMMDAALVASEERELSILWCCESARGVYARERFLALGSRVSKHLCIDASRTGVNAGMRWLNVNAACFVADSDVFLCGSPGFVWMATDLLEGAGIQTSRMHSDVYHYAPRI